MQQQHLKEKTFLTSLSLLFLCIALIFGIISWNTQVVEIGLSTHCFMGLSLILAIAANLLMFRSFVLGFLFSTFFMLISARIAGLNGLNSFSALVSLGIITNALHFCYSAYLNTQKPANLGFKLSLYEWQLTFIRLYIGFDLVPHFTEKLFAGSGPFLDDVHAFIALGVPHANFFVYLAGLCELGGAIAIGMGFLTRIGAIGITLYMLIATLLGHHFSLGFIWASPGGGWEYPLLWGVLLLSFAVAGANKFSLDYYLCQHYQVPSWIKCFMGIE